MGAEMSWWAPDHLVSTATLGLVLATVVVALVLDAANRWRYRRYTAKMTGPPALPFIGNGHHFMGNTTDLVSSLTQLYQKYGSPLKMWLGPSLFVLLDNPDDIQIVVTSSKSLAKHKSYWFFQAIRNSIFSADVERWKQSRRIINGAFTSKYLDSFVPAFNRLNQLFLKRINRFAGEGDFDAGEYFMGLTLAIICETAMGYDSDSIEDPHNNELLNIFRWLVSVDYSRIYKVWQYNDFIYETLFEDNVTKRYRKVVLELTADVITKRREFWRKEELKNKYATTKPEEPELNNFLDILLRTVDEKHLTDEYLQAETLVMIISGAETSALTDSFCCLLLAAHPDIQEKVRKEVDQVFGDGDCLNISPEQLDSMVYLEQVIKETLRRFCVAPIYLRESSTDLTLSTCTIPAGAAIAIGAQAMHMNPKYFPNPYKFDPDRWTPEEEAKRHKYSFMAFSNGPRGCIGAKFGMRSVKLTTGLMVRHFLMKTDVNVDTLHLKAEILLHSADGYYMSLENRRVCRCSLSQS